MTDNELLRFTKVLQNELNQKLENDESVYLFPIETNNQKRLVNPNQRSISLQPKIILMTDNGSEEEYNNDNILLIPKAEKILILPEQKTEVKIFLNIFKKSNSKIINCLK